jgi:hypothetical protein
MFPKEHFGTQIENDDEERDGRPKAMTRSLRFLHVCCSKCTVPLVQYNAAPK